VIILSAAGLLPFRANGSQEKKLNTIFKQIIQGRQWGGGKRRDER
jgi:hypothetical protein